MDASHIDRLFQCPVTGKHLEYTSHFTHAAPTSWLRMANSYAIGGPIGYLVSEDGDITYPVWKDFFGLLPELVFQKFESGLSRGTITGEKAGVAKFYDEFGWLESSSEGHFNDAIAFEDLRELTRFYRARCHRRVNRHLPGGKFLLDVASGPVQIPEYQSFSETYDSRICVDISVKGLLGAKRRLGDHAICVLGDITALPLRDGVVDNFVSLHTIYHVPADEQLKAVTELFRVLGNGRTGVIVYSWGGRALLNRCAERAARWIPPPGTGAATDSPLPPGLDLYFNPHDYAWYKREIASRFPAKLRVWRSVGKEFLQYFVRGPVSAALVLWPLLAGEGLFPSLFGKIGICPMFVLRKSA